MRIAFADLIDWDYNVESAYQIPMGGSQSALCYLAEALAKQGHDVFLLNNTSKAGMSCGVMHFPLSTVPHQLLRSLDVLIVQNLAGEGRHIRPLLGEKTCLVLWIEHAHDQPAVQALQNPLERDIYDAIVFVSEWQRNKFYQNFGIDSACSYIICNAIGPGFCGLFSPDDPILLRKSKPPIIAYTSTPFRGLDLLLDVFPNIRSAVPGTRLKVFSSMKVYQVAEADDESEYNQLYHLCRTTEGVEYVGSLSQPDLARELQSVTVLTYSNTFAETSCIAVMEAMASGCWVVTSDLGALPETTAGFARLIPIEGDWEVYKNLFIEETIRVLTACTATDPTAAETHLRRQVEYVNREYNWSVRAREWVQCLSSVLANKAIAMFPVPSDLAPVRSADLALLGYQCLIQNDYARAATFYEQAIEICPTLMSNYWHLGLILLLQGQEEEAQTTWMLAMVNGDSEQVGLWTAELVQVLQAEAERRNVLAEYRTVELIEQYIEDMTADPTASD
jgi:glycosyltransferase involved in cell wall biosynthesis